MRNVMGLLAGLTIASIASSAWAADADWPGWNGPNRDGRSPDRGLLKDWPAGGPKQVWKNDSIGKGYSTPIIAGGMIYILGDVGNDVVLFALDPADGTQKYKQIVAADFTADRPGQRSTPVYDNGKIYALCGLGELVCMDARDGRTLWHKSLTNDFNGRVPRWGYAESPLIYKNLVIATPGGRPAIIALDKNTGSKVWLANDITAEAHYCSAIATTQGDTTLIINGTGNGLFAVNAQTGAKVWSNPFATNNVANAGTPVVSDGLCFWAVGYNKGGVCVKLADGTKAWTNPDLVSHHGGYVVDNGYIYGNNDRGCVCIELKTGQTKWTGNGVGKGSICYADGMLYLFSESGQAGLAVASPDKLQMKGTFKVAGGGTSWAHPVVIGGRLYLRYNTNLYCLDVTAK